MDVFMVPDSVNPTTNHLEQKHLFGFRACPPHRPPFQRSCCHLVYRMFITQWKQKFIPQFHV